MLKLRFFHILKHFSMKKEYFLDILLSKYLTFYGKYNFFVKVIVKLNELNKGRHVYNVFKFLKLYISFFQILLFSNSFFLINPFPIIFFQISLFSLFPNFHFNYFPNYPLSYCPPLHPPPRLKEIVIWREPEGIGLYSNVWVSMQNLQA